MRNIENKTQNTHLFKNKYEQEGITLIALIITIIVMLILVGVTINMALNGGLFGYAKQGVRDTENKKAEEEALASGKVTINGKEYDSINAYLESIKGTDGTKTEENLTLTKSWTCSNGGVWSEAIPAGEKVEGNIIANLYTTGNKLDLTEEISVDLYKLVIEGTGKMGTIATIDEGGKIQAGYAWLKNIKETEELYDKVKNGELDLSTVDFSKLSDGVFIETVEIKEGITSMPDGAFYFCGNLKNIQIANSVNDIGRYAFSGTALTNVNLPSSLKTIKEYAFWASSLTSIEIPESVTRIEGGAVLWSSKLKKITVGKNVQNIGECAIGTGGNELKIVKILIENYENCEISSNCFGYGNDDLDMPWLSEGSTIYVLNEGMKNKLAGTYDPEKTEVKVVTLEEMNAI